MKSLLSLDELSNEEIMEILNDAQEFKQGSSFQLKDKIVANLFFEPSTRTHYSFNVAEEKLGMKVLNFDPSSSSLAKGESFYDTVKTFASFGIDAVVIRHTKNRYYDELAHISVPIINAGDGTKDHPSQTLLDLMTIYEEFHTFKGLNIAIIGDIRYSRVAHGDIQVMKRLGMNCYTSGPEEYQDAIYPHIHMEEALKEMDVIMMLRVQNERHEEKMSLSNEEYLQQYGLTMEKVYQMKSHAIIMHPAPVNRGVEIADEVVECPQSRIFEQIHNGVFVRESILKRTFTK